MAAKYWINCVLPTALCRADKMIEYVCWPRGTLTRGDDGYRAKRGANSSHASVACLQRTCTPCPPSDVTHGHSRRAAKQMSGTLPRRRGELTKVGLARGCGGRQACRQADTGRNAKQESVHTFNDIMADVHLSVYYCIYRHTYKIPAHQCHYRC